jgi:hypothetical protein
MICLFHIELRSRFQISKCWWSMRAFLGTCERVNILSSTDEQTSDYIRWVEDSFRQQNLKADVLILSPRLSEAAVIRRQIVEGVLAIVKLNTATLSKGKVNLQVFDRRGGAGNVQFNGTQTPLSYSDCPLTSF